MARTSASGTPIDEGVGPQANPVTDEGGERPKFSVRGLLRAKETLPAVSQVEVEQALQHENVQLKATLDQVKATLDAFAQPVQSALRGDATDTIAWKKKQNEASEAFTSLLAALNANLQALPQATSTSGLPVAGVLASLASENADLRAKLSKALQVLQTYMGPVKDAPVKDDANRHDYISQWRTTSGLVRSLYQTEKSTLQ